MQMWLSSRNCVLKQHNSFAAFHCIKARTAAQGSVKNGFSSNGSALKFDCSPDPNPVTDEHQTWQTYT